ncbi:hypothetical protein [Desulfosarcina cetonica]|uniref:hypothetical protein n=1 Tax=Desulfosarcina cetonica TaxID=90730 RepID=UPI0006CF686F|nr:hypothetical protein [Desulfosarcina cetonica]
MLPQKNGYKLLVAQQRGWDYTTTDACEDLDDDAGGLNAKDEPKQTFKPEGVAITDSGRTFVVTDNDGVDDWSGETWFLRLGDVDRLFE